MTAGGFDIGLPYGIEMSIDTKPPINIGANSNGSSASACTELLKWAHTDERQTAATEAYVNWLAADLRSIDTADSPAFREFVESLRTPWTIPTYDQAGDCLHQKSARITNSIAKILSEVCYMQANICYLNPI